MYVTYEKYSFTGIQRHWFFYGTFRFFQNTGYATIRLVY